MGKYNSYETRFTVFDPEMKSSLDSKYNSGSNSLKNSPGSAFLEYYNKTFKTSLSSPNNGRFKTLSRKISSIFKKR